MNKADGRDPPTPGNGWTNKDVPLMMYPQTQDGQVHLYQCHRRYIHTSHGWSRTGSACPNDAVAAASSGHKINHDDEAKVVRSLISQLSEKYYAKGWMPGTGGGMSIRIGSGTADDPFAVFSTPSGIQKEDMVGDDVFEQDIDQNVITPPITPGLKLSSMNNIWFVVYNLRPSTRCVIHTHSMYAQLATLLDPSEQSDIFQITHQEMIKGVGNHAYDSMLAIPIIDNQRSENLLAPDIEKVIQKYPKCNAVLVRRHGVYVWGDSWEEAKTRLESFDYLFETAVKMKSMGIDPGVVPKKKNADASTDTIKCKENRAASKDVTIDDTIEPSKKRKRTDTELKNSKELTQTIDSEIMQYA
uniref:Class II aldolase/adducin N-terminal domain-containing protein n=1 Tax=Chaetoceros debilis TaxID=122233 RepID=A0A7S3V7F0_9STRA|mmetsp:Transcript_5447/g.7719  ORF Transcript_5447/g.7719 Transcript_5447/m.7719 type:complete len:357 (-) Transcript_5447:49-1119(-)